MCKPATVFALALIFAHAGSFETQEIRLSLEFFHLLRNEVDTVVNWGPAVLILTEFIVFPDPTQQDVACHLTRGERSAYLAAATCVPEFVGLQFHDSCLKHRI